MTPGANEKIGRWIRMGAVALACLGMLALWHDHAGAQLGGLISKVVEKGKAKQAVPKAVPNLPKGKQINPAAKGLLQKGPLTKDAAGKNPKLPTGADRLPNDRVTKGKDVIGRDKLAKDKQSKDQFAKDKQGKDRLAQDKLSKDKLSKDKQGKDRQQGKDQVGKNQVGKNQVGKDKQGKDKLARDKAGTNKKAGEFKGGKGKALPDTRASTRIAKARDPVERGRIRVDHRRDILAARLRLPQRPFPGSPGFTGVPPVGETRFVQTEMVFHVGPNVSRQTVDATASRLGLTVVAVQSSGITGGTIYQFGVPQGRQVPDVVRTLEAERVGIASPNYVYTVSQETASDTASAAGSPDQYTIEKLRLAEVHKIATGRNVLVAVIDSKVDARHPDLVNAIAEEYDAVGRPEQAHFHGTGMAGAIVSHQKLLGIAPNARILAVQAFSTSSKQSAEATTRQIISGIEWAINKGARIINMSFAGPYDPLLQLAMRNAAAKGVVLIAASGNLGPKSPPLYPAADPNVIAVTATDVSDELFPQAVRGPHLAVAAPGVDVVVPAPADSYQLTTGTSVAAAHVSGVAALLLERHPDVTARVVLEVLTSTARNLNPKGRDDQFGWGLIDPAAALQELDSRIADGRLLATTKQLPGPSAKAAAPKSDVPKTAAPRPASTGPTPLSPQAPAR